MCQQARITIRKDKRLLAMTLVIDMCKSYSFLMSRVYWYHTHLIGLIDCTRAELDDFLISYYSGFAMHRPVSAIIGAILSVI